MKKLDVNDEMLSDPCSDIPSGSDTICHNCNANMPVRTEYGSVCGACGCVLDDLVLDGSPAHGREGPIRQSEIFRPHLPTKIGLPRETLSAPAGLLRANRYALDFESHVLQCAAVVIKDALERFGANTQCMFDACHAVFVKMYHAIPPRSPCRNIEVLSLAAIFHTAQVRRVSISCKAVQDFLLSLDRPLSSFRAALQETAKLFPRGSPRDVVLTLAGQLASRLALPHDVTALAAKVAKNFGQVFATRSKMSVAAAAVVATAVLAKGLRIQYPLSYIAEAGGVATSAVSRSIASACVSLRSPLSGAVAVSGAALTDLFDSPVAPAPLTPPPASLAEVTLDVV